LSSVSRLTEGSLDCDWNAGTQCTDLDDYSNSSLASCHCPGLNYAALFNSVALTSCITAPLCPDGSWDAVGNLFVVGNTAYRQCFSWRVCNATIEYEAVAPNATHNRVCAPLPVPNVLICPMLAAQVLGSTGARAPTVTCFRPPTSPLFAL